MATHGHEPIAIIGSGCRLPGGASTPSKLWHLLREPRDILKKIDRFNVDGFYHPDGHHHGTANVKHAHLLDEDFRLFDPGFFGIKPVEAESIDPLQRLLLETVYESLENAGLPMESLQGSDTAFYAGVMATDYTDILMRDVDTIPQYFATATARSILSNRISYVFDWHGPSMTIDTACSSSMLALHGAVQSLRSGESKVAVAAGGNLILGPELFIALSKVNMLSTKGRSAMWDADVDGYGRGEGFVAVVLKPLKDAIRDGDHVDCVIREAATNQDGRTMGITMPSASAQAQLIRRAYADVGLNLENIHDRPQFFEAHGTGTKAGDPQEAEAIHTAFFGSDIAAPQQKDPLYVGGIKTVVGHTEGTAGLAGLLKASLALQAKEIPPNLLFNNLNPELVPFYGSLEVPTQAISWPSLPEGVPRRASVNSFGKYRFGGANTHVILESAPLDERETSESGHPQGPALTPFVFSANSESALQRLLVAFKEHLQVHPETNLSDLSWTLRARRSALPVKIALSAPTANELQHVIDEKLQKVEETPGSSIGVRSTTGSLALLGIFTGQGAQWPRMCKELIDTVPLARELVGTLDQALQTLPDAYRPSWRLLEELERDGDASRLQEAAFSQPLCTVVQVVLVELLRTAGIVFTAVVGHSSGEIGAAYAAGFLSATDAIKIAYLRGFCAPLAKGPAGEKGAMMAVGASIEEAEELCRLPELDGRIKVAASNSSSSLTLSGDAEAITTAKAILDERKVFARLLKVDTAYHSHHMQPCAEPYVSALEAAGITVQSPTGSCMWFSSVLDGDKVEANEALRATYWRDNMVNTVMFSQALSSAVKNSAPLHMALEVGPHPALKGPATQTLGELDIEIPYAGMLKRGASDLAAFSDCLAAVWTNLGSSAVDFEALQALLPKNNSPKLLKNLPTYAWDHEKPYWYESRKSKAYRTRSQPPHELLGTRYDDGSENELRWRNFLSVQELPWLEGHQIQGQVVYPAAGYVAMVLEAGKIMADGKDVQLLEVESLVIGRAIVFHDEKTGVETTTTLSRIIRHEKSITADFTISAHISRDATDLTKVASGSVKVTLGVSDQSSPAMPKRRPAPAHLIDVDTDRFYSALEKTGYGYTGNFRAFSDMKRRLDFCTGFIESAEGHDLLVHPGMLDHAFQALFGTYCWPGDGRLWALFLPTSIRKVTVDPSRCRQVALDGKQVSSKYGFDAWLLDSPPQEMRGDVVFSQSAGSEEATVLRVEGASMSTLGEATPSEDRRMFFETIWGVASPDGSAAVGTERASETEWELAEACERVGHYYWRKLDESITPSERENCAEHHKHLLHAVTHLLARPMDGKNSYLKPQWRDDDEKVISELIEKYNASVDIRLAASVGRALPSVIRGETTMLEHMRPNGMLDEFYGDSLGLPASNRWLGRMVKQLAHRHPRMNFLEIGAGTGSSTQAVLDVLRGDYSSYMFTDISSGFFEKAAERFADAGAKMTFKTLDVEKSIADQGYAANSYDVVIASNVLHATTSLHSTLQNVRSLLKPGGYLFLLEITDNTTIRYSFTMGGLPGWWLGVGDGRPYSPCIAPSKWNQALRKAGFAGVDAVTPARDLHPNPFSIVAAQAVDERTDQLRKPLLKVSQRQEWSTLYILGGQEIETSHIVEDVTATLGHVFDEFITVDRLLDLNDADLPTNATVLNLLDLDGPVFKDLSADELGALQVLVERAHNMLWVTHAQKQENPWSNAVVGFLRSVSAELPTLRAQVLDFDAAETPRTHSRIIAEALLRLLAADTWEQDPEFKDKQLWTTEPELRFNEGKLWVPRVVEHKQNNDRLNTGRRTIKQAAVESTPFGLSRSQEDDSWTLRQSYEPKTLPSGVVRETVAIRVKYSTLWAPKLKAQGSPSAAYLTVGKLVETGEWVVAAAAERGSVIYVSQAWTTALPSEFIENPVEFIEALLSESLSVRIADLASGTGGLVLVHEPRPLLASSLSRKAKEKGFRVGFVTQDPAKISSPQWIHVHPRESAWATRTILPKDPVAFVHFTHEESRSYVNLISESLPQTCEIIGESYFLFKEAVIHSDQGDISGLESLVAAAKNTSLAAEIGVQSVSETHVVSLADLTQQSEHVSSLSLIDWQYDDSLQLEVVPPQSRALFKSDRSYMLVGMTGEMGQSLCRWMVQSGAGAVIMTSRNPKIDQAWVDELQTSGSKIKIAGFDATSRTAWIKFAAEIKQELPPLAGIINGAVVLQDQLFLDMDIDVFNKTLAPKIDSTIHLDEVFRDDALDFFIVFSSLSSIIGNRGQANYNAANAFMTSLVKQRKARGQAASVLQLGSVVGVGYLTRAGDVMETILIKYGYLPVAEVDLHHLVAQCIMAGVPGSGENPDLITGLRYAREDEVAGLHWATNPRFSHMVLPPETESLDSGEKKATLSTRAQLAAANTEQEARKALEDCFGAKLRAILQVPESSFRPEAALIELGVDSLVAVEIRSWFLKELTVDMAVLKILGGASTISLCQYAIEQAPKELLPGISNANSPDAPPETAPPKVSEVPAAVVVPLATKEIGNNTVRESIQPASVPEDSSSSNSIAASSPSGGLGSPASSIVNEEISPDPEISERVRISSAQSRFWFLSKFLEDQTASNVTFSYKIRGRLNVARLSRAVKVTANAHQALRACFLPDDSSSEKAWQGLMKESKLELQHQEVSGDDDVASVYERVRHTVYDLRQGLTMQIILLSQGLMEHTIIFGYHHIVLDGVGFEAFLADLEKATAGQPPSPQGLQYLKFSEREGLEIEQGSLENNLEYWRNEFKHTPPLLPVLPVSKVATRQPISRYGSTYVEHRLDTQLASKIKAVCRQFHVTASHFYLATFRTMLLRLAGIDEICIGVADANRHDSSVMSTVGLFLNMLPIFFKKATNTAFGDVLRDTRAKVWEGLAHAGVPFDELLQALRLPRSSTHSPLFQAFFDYHQGAQEKRKFGSTTWENANRHPGERAYDITLDVIEGSAGSLVALIGQDYLYDGAGMQKLLDCYLTLLQDFADKPSINFDKARIHGQGQIDAALDLGRGPTLAFEWSATLGHRVREMCWQFPDQIAVKSDGGSQPLTYRDLERKARAIRDKLLSTGVESGDRVAVFQEPTPDWIVSVIAIFWAGAVYVPLVLLNPMPRLAAIVRAAEPKAVLVHQATIQLASELQSGKASIIDVSEQTLEQAGSSPTSTSILVSGEDPAVILFTSGSTGVPKGIVLRHRNLANHIEGYVKAWNIGREVVLQQSAFSFDLSIGQIFTALAMGGTLVVASRDTRRDPTALVKLIRQESITWTLLTPSEYSGVLQVGSEELRQASHWAHALACGEALTRKLVREFARLGHETLRLYNAYGPAEAIISATMAEINIRDDKEEGAVTAGTPNPNYSIYIVDDQGNALPQGFPGEIWIGGCGIAVGYLNDEPLTKSKFLKGTFESTDDKKQGWNVTYRTGDMGRLREDGTLTYEGRREGDSQVKIRGFRVDLLEIEAAILEASHGILTDAVVTMRAESQHLIAHVIFSGVQLAPDDRAEYLSELLPTLPLPIYMQPTMAVPVADFPKNIHGKKDRSVIAKLPLPQQSPQGLPTKDVIVEELSAVEARLAKAWREVLPEDFAGHFTIGASTDFFAVGGNSLLLVKLQARIRDAFDVSLPLIKLLDAGTLGVMAARIEASRVVRAVDWDNETALGDELVRLASKTARVDDNERIKTQARTVLLTGVTGYLGPYLLRQLIDDPTVKTIHCVAVRGDNLARAQSRIPDSLMSSGKVIVHAGDLSAQRIGLRQDIADSIASTVDLIIHSGAKRSFWDSYYELRSTNVSSTRELLRLAAPRRVPIEFLSSSGVLLLDDLTQGYGSKAEEAAASVAASQPPVDGSEGYVASKWASEVILEEASRELGIPVTIHRFTPRATTSPDESAGRAALEDLVVPTTQLGAIPERSTWAGRFDVVETSRLVQQILTPGEGEGSNDVRHVHHQSEAGLSPDDLFDFLEERLSDKVGARLGLLEWVGAIKRAGYGWLFSTHDLALTTSEHGVTTTLVNRR